MKSKLSREIRDTASKDPSNWRGVFYFNRKDSRIVVPKINPATGWTFNLANPYSYLLIVGIVLIIILAKIFL